MTEVEKKLLQAVTTQGGGRDIHEIMEMTGLTYKEIENACYTLVSKGVELVALPVGYPFERYRWGNIKRIFLSKYDSNYDEIMKQNA